MGDEEEYVGEHVLILGNDFVSGLWVAGCSCGWEAREQHPGSDAAEDDWENHCDVVFMEATGG